MSAGCAPAVLTPDREGAKKGKDEDRVVVAVRVRPFVACADGDANTENVVGVTRDGAPGVVVQESVNGRLQDKTYNVDHVFTDSQKDVYDAIGAPMLHEALNGYNVCIFAYGQTGSGKTYSTMGPPDQMESPDSAGLIYRICSELHRECEQRMLENPNLECKVSLSFAEVYKEKVHDLLSVPSKLPPGQGLPALKVAAVQRGKQTVGWEAVDLTRRKVTSSSMAVNFLRQGLRHRKQNATAMNPDSSRSHSIATLHIAQMHTPYDPLRKDKESKLMIVDLAGSERTDKTNPNGMADPKLLRETEFINVSLLTLSKCLQQTVNPDFHHVSVRESTLTKLISNVFGGNAKTAMLATVSPSKRNLPETISTLTYAMTAKMIKQNAEVNIATKQLELAEARAQVKALEEALKTALEQGSARQEVEDERQRATAILEDTLKGVLEDNARLKQALEARDATVAELRDDVRDALSEVDTLKASVASLTASLKESQQGAGKLKKRGGRHRDPAGDRMAATDASSATTDERVPEDGTNNMESDGSPPRTTNNKMPAKKKAAMTMRGATRSPAQRKGGVVATVPIAAARKASAPGKKAAPPVGRPPKKASPRKDVTKEGRYRAAAGASSSPPPRRSTGNAKAAGGTPPAGDTVQELVGAVVTPVIASVPVSPEQVSSGGLWRQPSFPYGGARDDGDVATPEDEVSDYVGGSDDGLSPSPPCARAASMRRGGGYCDANGHNISSYQLPSESVGSLPQTGTPQRSSEAERLQHEKQQMKTLNTMYPPTEILDTNRSARTDLASVASSAARKRRLSGGSAAGDQPKVIKLVPGQGRRYGAERVVRTFEGHSNSVYSCDIAADGSGIVSCGKDNTVRAWDPKSNKARWVYRAPGKDIRCLALGVSSAANAVVVGSSDCAVRMLSYRTGEVVRELEKKHTSLIHSVRFAPGHKEFATASCDGTVRVWDTKTGEKLKTLVAHKASVYSFDFAPDGIHAASVGDDQCVKVWKWKTASVVASAPSPTAGTMWSVRFHPSGKILATGSKDGSVNLWCFIDTAALTSKGKGTGDGQWMLKCTTTFPHTQPIQSVAFTSKNAVVVAAGSKVTSYALPDCETTFSFSAHKGIVYKVVVSDNAALTASADSTLKLWKL